MTYAWHAEPTRSLAEVHLELCERRLTLLLRQANLKAETILLTRELETVERRLAMIEAARAAA